MPVKKNKSHKFTLPVERFGKAPEPEWIKLNHLSMLDIEAINKDITETIIDYVPPKKKNGKPNHRAAPWAIEREKCTDKHERMRRQWELMIEDWCIYDDNGKIGSDRDSIYNALMTYPELLTFISECTEAIEEGIIREKENLEKN